MLKVDRNQSVVQPFLAQNQAQTGNYEALNDIFKGENTYIYIGNYYCPVKLLLRK